MRLLFTLVSLLFTGLLIAALSLVVLEGLSYAQAAEVLETPIGTIMSRIARARAALSKALRAESPPIGAGLATGAG